MHACLFDIDGTLINTGGAGQAAMEHVLEAEFEITAPTEGISTAGRTDRAIVSDLFDYHEINGDQHTWDRFLTAYLQHLPSQLQRLDGAVLPGIAALIRQLHDIDHVMLGLLTGNFREGARLKLEHFELNTYFDFGGFGDRHHDRDDVARDAMAELDNRHGDSIHPDRIWVIGDTPADVRCGRAIGAQVVAVGTGLFSEDELRAAEPDYLFSDFSDPATLLELLEG